MEIVPALASCNNRGTGEPSFYRKNTKLLDTECSRGSTSVELRVYLFRPHFYFASFSSAKVT